MKRKYWDYTTLLSFAAIVLVLFIVYTFTILPAINKAIKEQTVDGVVTEKNVKRHGKTDRYLIYTKTPDGETTVYEITDSILKWRFDSSDLYAEIQVGKTYTFTICGSRVPLLSLYPNIYQAELKEKAD